MQYSNFPSIGKKISKLGFGLMRLPKLSPDSEAIDRAEAKRIVELAYRAGVNYFDTAYGYHNGESELFAGEALSQYPRSSYCLASKLPGWVLKEGKTPEELFEEQLQKCRTTYFDFYLFHSVTEDIWPVFEKAGSYEYLRAQKAAGRIGKLGFSFHGGKELFTKVLAAHEWDFVQLQLNYYDWEASDAKWFYTELEKRHIPCVVMEPVRGGSLQTLNAEALEELEKLGADNSPASYALRFAGTLPNVLTVLSGMSDYSQVQDNLATFDDLSRLTEREIQAVKRANLLFRKNFAIPCTSCKYCTATCPGGVDIPGCFSAFNHYNLTRKTEDFLSAYEAVDAAARADSCIGCRECMEHCPQQIKIPDRLSEINALGK